MRPIDGDALKERLQSLAYDDWNQGTSTTWASAYSEVADMIDDFPSADVREVKRGRWEYNSSEEFEEVFIDTWKCSCCGECVDSTIHIREYCVELEYKFCPNCGADMRRKYENQDHRN